MTKYLRNIGAVLLLMVCQSLFAGSGLFFNVSATGTPADVGITLCLNGTGPLSCQNYNVSALSLNICAVPSHFYPNAGIKINTPGYKISNLGMDCAPLGNGYCIFPVSNTSCKHISLVANGQLSISPTSLPAATVNTTYSQTIATSGGVAPYTYAIISGSLPTGLSLNASTGVISGIPTTGGTYPFTITATDSNTPIPNTGSQAYSVVVRAVTLSPPTLPAGQLSTAYNQTITASGGVGPYIFTVTSGILPPGLTLSASGAITGTPTSNGTYPFTITATDTNSSVTGSQAYSVVVSGSLALSPPTLPAGQLSTPYNQTITASGGVGPYTFAVTFGNLPPGLALSASGAITGTPTSVGTYPFTITATDTNSSDTGSQGYSVVVSGSLTLSPPILPAGQLSTPYNLTVTANGGVGPYTFAVTFGNLPPGLALSASGAITGTPTSVGTYPFTITATDTNSSDTGSQPYSVVVSGSLTLSPTTLPAGQLSTAYSKTITASGGVGPYTFAVTSGFLPYGLVLSASGAITGTPTSIGTYPFTITATDTNSSDTGAQGYSVLVSGSLQLSPTTLPVGQLSSPYNQTITASGGVGPYTFAVTFGSLPPGLGLSASGAITGTPTTPGTYLSTITATDTNSSDTGSQAYSIGVEVSAVLSSSFNVFGSVPDNSSFDCSKALDSPTAGTVYSSNQLGSSLIFNGILMKIGATGGFNAIRSTGQTISLPQGNFSHLNMLAIATEGNKAAQVFKVTYTDNSQSTFTQDLSDWATPQNYAGETIVKSMAYRDICFGSFESISIYIYGYVFNINNSKITKTITLPNNVLYVDVLSITLS